MFGMPKRLGQIKKPSVEESAASRKLYCIPLLFSTKEAPQDYVKMFDQYWHQVKDHIGRLEKAGATAKIYYETISSDGKDGLKVIQRQNERVYRFVKSIVDQGASLEALEDEKLFNEYIDWSMCLSVVRSPDVAEKILKFYRTSEQRRDKHVAGQIDETLKEGEAAILLMRDENRIRIQSKFSPDIQIFLVRPPALNDIYRWLRNQAAKTIDES